jgi:hypothetical protein
MNVNSRTLHGERLYQWLRQSIELSGVGSGMATLLGDQYVAGLWKQNVGSPLVH